MNILVLEREPDIKLEYLDYLKKYNKLLTQNSKYSDDDIEVIIVRSKVGVGVKLLDKYPNLKYVARVGVGLDHIDVKECEKRNIKVLNTPGANSDSVADLIIGGVLNLRRKLYKGYDGFENRFDYMGVELSSSTVSIIGFGNIGRKVYKRLLSFGVKEFLIYDPFISKEDIETNEFCKKTEDKKEIFKNANVITFHIPLLDSTRNFLGQKEIKLLKKDALIINTSRGGIINENKLVEFLSENQNAGFFADVWEEEPNDPKLDLLELENVLVTPHIGAMTKQADEKMHFFKDLI